MPSIEQPNFRRAIHAARQHERSFVAAGFHGIRVLRRSHCHDIEHGPMRALEQPLEERTGRTWRVAPGIGSHIHRDNAFALIAEWYGD